MDGCERWWCHLDLSYVMYAAKLPSREKGENKDGGLHQNKMAFLEL